MLPIQYHPKFYLFKRDRRQFGMPLRFGYKYLQPICYIYNNIRKYSKTNININQNISLFVISQPLLCMYIVYVLEQT